MVCIYTHICAHRIVRRWDWLLTFSDVRALDAAEAQESHASPEKEMNRLSRVTMPPPRFYHFLPAHGLPSTVSRDFLSKPVTKPKNVQFNPTTSV